MMFNKTALLVLILFITSTTSTVTYTLESPTKYTDSDSKDIDATYNGMPIARKQYLMNRIMVTGVVFDHVNPKDSFFVTVDPAFDLRKGSEFTSTFEASNEKELPSFELEYGREPLEYLTSMLKSKYGLNVYPNKSLGMSNQYGFSLKTVPADQYPGSKMEHYNHDADDLNSLVGPLLGSYMTTANNIKPNEIDQTNMESKFDWSSVDNNMDKVPVTNIVYLLNLEPSPEDDPLWVKFMKKTNFMDVAQDMVDNSTKSDLNYVISRVILMENAIARADLYNLNFNRRRRILL